MSLPTPIHTLPLHCAPTHPRIAPDLQTWQPPPYVDHPDCPVSFHSRGSPPLLCLSQTAWFPTSWDGMWPNFSPALNLINPVPVPLVLQIPLWVTWGPSSVLCHVHRTSFLQTAPEAVHRCCRSPQPKWSPWEPKMLLWKGQWEFSRVTAQDDQGSNYHQTALSPWLPEVIIPSLW